MYTDGVCDSNGFFNCVASQKWQCDDVGMLLARVALYQSHLSEFPCIECSPEGALTAAAADAAAGAALPTSSSFIFTRLARRTELGLIITGLVRTVKERWWLSNFSHQAANTLKQQETTWKHES